MRTVLKVFFCLDWVSTSDLRTVLAMRAVLKVYLCMDWVCTSDLVRYSFSYEDSFKGVLMFGLGLQIRLRYDFSYEDSFKSVFLF